MNNNPSSTWKDRETRAKIAETRAASMEERYRQEIALCSGRTVTYRGAVPTPQPTCNAAPCTQRLTPLDSVSAAYRERQGKTAILNFASYRYPGGGFLSGSRAQEECLCHESFLYNVLSRQEGYYARNKQTENRGLYTNAALYTPDVMFEHNGIAMAFDVLTCAAPNYSTASCRGVSRRENRAVLRSRIRFVLDILSAQGVSTAILGAFGCGVFGQDAAEVAELFREEADATAWVNPVTLVYAVMDSARGGNYQKFLRVLG